MSGVRAIATLLIENQISPLAVTETNRDCCMLTEAKNKPSARTVYAVAALALILGIAASVGAYGFFQNPRYFVLTGVKETEVTFVNSLLRNTTQTLIYENGNWTASYELGNRWFFMNHCSRPRRLA